MAATKVMKFWAVCLAVLGKLLATFRYAAPGAAACRRAALYGDMLHGSAPYIPATVPASAAPAAAPDPGPGAPESAPARRGGIPEPAAPAGPRKTPVSFPPAASAFTGSLFVPAMRAYGRPQLPPTIKQRIRAEAHGSSPTSRSRLATGVEPLPTVSADGARQGAADEDDSPATIPAARSREHHACTT
ncbi:DUF6344 domain-containing protein [Streptomyces pinistramenti]|uniref:DUF6344 domain-containing protein n=1 Tax=Streptomyces pinistramenti TaxID=2884812 RepID=UPI001D084137|nr:DUF6344 domain-containing protein [Streptomyces pinistramenti]MCB5908625.1 DUF6344 domain-containing protein [Streptomyces pinistramenti]